MNIRSVALPEELVHAHRDGELVLFVGAGASRGAPSGLPGFPGLTRIVLEAVEAGDLLERLERNEPLDTLLGRLAERDVDVHRLVAEQLDRPGSRPNALHRAIVALADAGPPIRIVTTNYDRHLSTALQAAAVDVEEYCAPALPMGDDFKGLVYLHGSLSQDPRHLVVTDRDFGRAYLRDAWAARFLERMYSAYTVLFLGYSHADIVMRYLARSLSTAMPRFAFTDKPDDDDWRSLGISPIGYRLDEGDHYRLPEAVAAWATEASRGLLDHRQRVRELVGGAPTGVPDEESYLEATLADVDRIRFFAEFAEHERWLPWVTKRPEFRQLFDPQADPEPQSHTLGRWFVDRFALREERTGAALKSVHEAGGRLSPGLWEILAHAIWTTDPRPNWLGPWLVLLVEQAPTGRLDLLGYLLADLTLPEERSAALLLFERLTRPYGAVEAVWPPLEGARIAVGIAGDDHWLREAWATKLAPTLPTIAPEILSITDRHLRRAHHLLVTAAADADPFDPLNFGRSAVRPHPQDSHPEPIDVLLDAGRDSLEAALDANMQVADAYIEAWSSTSIPLLRRLALHGLTQRADFSANDKLDWVLHRDWLFDLEARAEVFELLRSVASDLDGAGGRRLIDAINLGPDLDDAELQDRARFDRLTWVLDAAPDLPGGPEALAKIQSRHPGWVPSKYPELTFHIETGWHKPNPPMTPDELHERLNDDPQAALHELRSYEGAGSAATGATWGDTLGLIADTVRTHPSDGMRLLDAAQDLPTTVTAAIVRGWSRAHLKNAAAAHVLERLLALDLDDVVGEVADLLESGGRRDDSPTEWFRIPQARELAIRTWDAIDDGDPPPEVEDWLGHAINHPAGKLAEFWMQALASDWESADDSWDGLTMELTSPLEHMLSDSGLRGALAEPVIASQLRLLHGADPDWTRRHVLPLLDWSKPARALRAWHGFLSWGRPTRPLFRAGLLDHYLQTVENAELLTEQLRRQLAHHLAGIATSPEPPAGDWVGRFTVAAGETLRLEWLDAIGWMLRDLPADEVAAQWNGWLKPYWQDRLRTIPIALITREASAMAGWLPHLGEAIPEAVELLVQEPASLDANRLMLRDLVKDPALLESHPVPIAEALAHLLEHMTGPLRGCSTLRNIVERLRTAAPPDLLAKIREYALQAGCDGAADW